MINIKHWILFIIISLKFSLFIIFLIDGMTTAKFALFNQWIKKAIIKIIYIYKLSAIEKYWYLKQKLRLKRKFLKRIILNYFIQFKTKLYFSLF